MTDYKELIAELRDRHNEDRYKRLTLEAANAIEALDKENTDLIYENGILKMKIENLAGELAAEEWGRKFAQKEAQHE